MTQHATGRFQVQLQPQGDGDTADGVSLGRILLDKAYSGDLSASGKGEMLSVRAALPGSAAYVAIERVSGALHGLEGSFVLVHRGVMSGSGQSLLIEVAPDSGTGDLQGISGSLAIAVQDGDHRYDFTYTLPAAR